MHVIFIKKRSIITIFLVFVIAVISIVYTRYFRTGTLGVLLNNDRIMPIYSVEVPDKRIALTFDTAWGEQYVQDIIDTLKRYNIKATFFLTGAWVDRYPDMVESIDCEGHEIGNHSNTHVRMTGFLKDRISSEIMDTELKILKITGKRTRLFRAPFGEYDNILTQAVRDMDYNMIQWDIDSLDWKGAEEKDLYERVTSKSGNGSIILFHSGIDNMASALPQIIEKLRKDGYQFITVSELIFKNNYYIDNTGRQRSLK